MLCLISASTNPFHWVLKGSTSFQLVHHVLNATNINKTDQALCLFYGHIVSTNNDQLSSNNNQLYLVFSIFEMDGTRTECEVTSTAEI